MKHIVLNFKIKVYVDQCIEAGLCDIKIDETELHLVLKECILSTKYTYFSESSTLSGFN